MNWCLTDAEIELRMKCFTEGIPSGEAAVICGCSVAAYRKWITKHGGKAVRKNGYPKSVVDNVRELALDCYKDEEIACKLELDKEIVYNIRRAHGIPSISCLTVENAVKVRSVMFELREQAGVSEYNRGLYDGFLKVINALSVPPKKKQYIPVSERNDITNE